jgi:hypothetical protein
MQAGDTFFLHDDGHLCVILKVLDDGSVIHCHVTTLRGRSDRTCIIPSGQHDFIKQDSVFRYDQAIHCEVGLQLNAFERIVRQGKQYPSFTPDLLAKAIDGALKSPQTPAKIKVLLSPA